MTSTPNQVLCTCWPVGVEGRGAEPPIPYLRGSPSYSLMCLKEWLARREGDRGARDPTQPHWCIIILFTSPLNHSHIESESGERVAGLAGCTRMSQPRRKWCEQRRLDASATSAELPHGPSPRTCCHCRCCPSTPFPPQPHHAHMFRTH